MKCFCSVSVYLSPPKLVSLLSHPPVCVTHHGYQQVEQQNVGDHGEGTVQHMDDRRGGDGVVHGQIDETHTQLKLGEEGDWKGAIRGNGLRLLRHVHHPQSLDGKKEKYARSKWFLKALREVETHLYMPPGIYSQVEKPMSTMKLSHMNFVRSPNII